MSAKLGGETLLRDIPPSKKKTFENTSICITSLAFAIL
jgi:hypothetical protein